MLYVCATLGRDWSSIQSSNTSVFLQRKIRMHSSEINSYAWVVLRLCQKMSLERFSFSELSGFQNCR